MNEVEEVLSARLPKESISDTTLRIEGLQNSGKMRIPIYEFSYLTELEKDNNLLFLFFERR
ncbi:hypothetical protein [Leptospira ainazelensis]|uniref:hypothetical protein n=1 Tax=Leptospira ainazelensis TaxID=2810034 RepID=UPI001962309E|nr:hypothetical protein [Leptospira ainazelensis]